MSETALYDASTLLVQMRDARSPGRAARDFLESSQEQLNTLFRQRPIQQLVRQRAAMVDTALISCWRLFDLDQDPSLAMVAVGGYGRGELHPCSDVDLLVLSDGKLSPQSKDNLERFVTLLWDIGLEVGHSVRTVDECVELAAEDITIATNIMELRTLSGNPAIGEKLSSLTGPDQIWPSDKFFQAKLEEQVGRHNKHNNTEYNLEPDLKNAPGGLRDLQMIGWVAKRHFGADTLRELVDIGFITPAELSMMEKCQDLLWEIRWALHMLTGRNENRLLFDYQRQVAAHFGFEDSKSNLAVEQFMKRYYRRALSVSVLNDVLLQLFEEAILNKDQPAEIVVINRRFQTHNGYLELRAERTIEAFPSALIEAFVLLAQNPEIKGLRASTVRALIQHRKMIDEAYRNDSRNTSLFMELLRSPNALYTQLRRMKRYGLLGQYLPEFGGIIGMMQYDLFHKYTVDAHTLLVLRNMRRMRYDSTRDTLPLAHEVFYRLPKPELLYIAGLYHDIAKGRGGDHSELGAHDAMVFCKRHGLSSWDAKLVSWLVRSHLLMSVTAQRKDISDPDVVHEFAQQVGDLVHLDYLYALTVADINGTDPNLWNSWRASLLRQLYRETKRALRRGLNNPVERHDWIDETRVAALTLLKQRGADVDRVEKFWAGLGDEYFLREHAVDIAWHTEAILKRTNLDGPMVLVGDPHGTSFDGGTQIFIYTPDTENLFATTATALDQLGLSIVDARVITSADGFTLDTYVVLDEHGTSIGNDPGRIENIRSTLAETLHDPSRFQDILERRMPRQNKHFDVPTEVTISNDINNDHSVIEIVTLDRPGLLARIGQIFARFHVAVQNARIATLGERAEDVFFVTDAKGDPISDPQLCIELRNVLRDELAVSQASSHQTSFNI